MPCLDEAQVLAFVAGELGSDVRDHVEAHLDRCPDCLTLVAELARGSLSTHSRADVEPAIAGERSTRYEIGEEIARGGMGTVHVARDRALDRKVAVKLMRLDAAGAGLAWRFAREVTLTARLQHPSIVPIYDAAVLEDGTPFYAMRLVGGQTLDRAIATATTMAERLALVPAVLAVAEAIAYAHSEGVVHRDLKPQNVLVGKFGETVVLDWGLAHDVHGVHDDRAGASGIAGTIAYMAPEVLRGEPAEQRSDVYGLGCILYQMLVAEPPRRRADDEPAPPSHKQVGVPAELEAIVARAMQHDPAQRYASAGELAQDLQRFLTGKLVAVHEYSLRELLMRWIHRHRGAITVAAVSMIGIAVILALAFHRVVEQRETAQTERDVGERERLAAEDLVTYMLDDLQAKLAAIGRIDLLVGTARSVDDYFANAPARAGAFGDRARHRRGQTLTLLGTAAIAHGDFATARTYYDRTLGLARAAAILAPSASVDDALCDALLGRAQFARASGETSALSLAGECLAIARLHAMSYDNRAAWQFRVASALGDQGVTARVRGDLKSARALLERASATLDTIAPGATLPPGESLDASRSTVLDNLTMVGLMTSDLALARPVAEKNLAASEADLAAHPDDANLQSREIAARTNMAVVRRRAGELDGAIAELRAARDQAVALSARDSSNVAQRRALGTVMAGLADAELEHGNAEAALDDERHASDISRELAAIQPTNREAQSDLVADELEVATILHTLHRDDEASRELVRAVAAAEANATAHPDPTELHDLATVLVHQADVENDRHHPELAVPPLLRALDLYRKALAAADTPQARLEVAETLLLEIDLPAAKRGAADDCALLDEARDTIAPLQDLARGNVQFAEIVKEVATARRAHARCDHVH